MPEYFAHESSYIDDGAQIGKGTKIWHFCHVMPGAVIGERCNLGQNVVVMSGSRLGNNVKVQNNVSIYEGVVLEDDVFCGPSCVFTNVVNPRSHVSRKAEYQSTLVRRGTSIGANATILCGTTLGEYSFIGAGAVVSCGGTFDNGSGSPLFVFELELSCSASLMARTSEPPIMLSGSLARTAIAVADASS